MHGGVPEGIASYRSVQISVRDRIPRSSSDRTMITSIILKLFGSAGWLRIIEEVAKSLKKSTDEFEL